MNWQHFTFGEWQLRWRVVPLLVRIPSLGGREHPVLEIKGDKGLWLRGELKGQMNDLAVLGPLPGRPSQEIPYTVIVRVKVANGIVTMPVLQTLCEQLWTHHRRKRYRGRIIPSLSAENCVRVGLDPKVWAYPAPPSEKDRNEAERRRVYLDRQETLDAAYTDRRCANCNQPAPSWRRTCKRCGRPV
jgi:hypothetical protein